MKPGTQNSHHTPFTIRAEADSFKYLLSLLPAVLVITGNLAGGYFTSINIIFSIILLPLADWLLPANVQKPKPNSGVIPDFILLLAVLFHTTAVATLLYAIYTGIITEQWIWVAALSTGFSSGILGINAAHELIHRKEHWLQNLGIWNLFLSNYTHFYIEHRLGHHVRVGLHDDPATASITKVFITFSFAPFQAQWKSALRIEAKRLAKHRKNMYGLQNFVFRALVCQTVFMRY
jgi:alkane 1-monooxygenase